MRSRFNIPSLSQKIITVGDFPVVWRKGIPYHRDTGEKLKMRSLEEFLKENDNLKEDK